MMVRRTLEGALKCALRDFRREHAIAIVEKNSPWSALRNLDTQIKRTLEEQSSSH